MTDGAGLVRPDVSEADAVRIARDCYGVEAMARELGSNQDRNFVLVAADGTRSVLRIDNPVFGDDARDAQHAALDAYRAAGVAVPAVLPGLDGGLIQRWNGFAIRRSEFAVGEPMVDAGYLAPVVLAEFGMLAAASVEALAGLRHPGLDRAHMWDMRVAHAQTLALAPSITDAALRERVVRAADRAAASLSTVADRLPVQAVHGDLTDDNVTGRRGDDSRLHPHVVLDLGDLAYGWRIAELAVCASSLLHHEPERPLRVLDAVEAFHGCSPLSEDEAAATWPLIVLRAALLVASGWRQLEIDGGNEYARERVAGEQAIFDAATSIPLVEATEHVLARLGLPATRFDHDVVPLLPDLGIPVVADPGVESVSLDGGAWTRPEIEQELVDAIQRDGTHAAVLPYGVFRLTRTLIDTAEAASTWPIETEVHVSPAVSTRIVAPLDGVLRFEPAGLAIDTVDGWCVQVRGDVVASMPPGDVSQGAEIARLTASADARTLRIAILRGDAPETAASADGTRLVEPSRVPAWRRLSADPAAMLGITPHAQQDESASELNRRERIFAKAQERYYAHPPQIQRGWRHHLVDTTARAYIDMVNNVAGLGHGHPGVADAANAQLRMLGTNSRFLYRELAEYSERLIALMPEGSGLDTVLLVNSGSEAVDLAIRLAQAATRRTTVVALREAYHGWTMASDAVTTSAYDNPDALTTRPAWVHVADVPNPYRGTHRGEGSAEHYLADLARDLDRLDREGREVAAFLCESVLGNAGGVLLPDGYLPGAYERVRAHGGICIADEVQVGFGRMGTTFWGFEQTRAVPDIVTVAKPMGNGFPLGGVITSRAIADALSGQGQFFSSAGGSTVSCRVGLAVLDAMAEEGLQGNAAEIGRRLAAGLGELADRHPLIGTIHGAGLYLGVELVRNRESREPAAAEAAAICERLRELGVIVLTTSERSNVLKIKPPLCLSAQSADHVVAMLDRVLTEGW
ncbi:aminotransferase [Microbacterium sp. NPDC055903]